jgi:hypothetical protein
LIAQYTGNKNFKFYQTQSKIDKARNIKFVNMEVSTKAWWSLGLNVATSNYCAPTLIVNDIYSKIGAKTEFKQLELIASNYMADRPEAMFCAYEAATIAYVIKCSERERAESALKLVSVGH